MSAEKFNVNHHDPHQRLKFFKKLIKLNNDSENEVAFVPQSPRSETNESINSKLDSSSSRKDESKTTTVIIETGNKFAYDTINNNGNSENENVSNPSDDEKISSSSSPEAIVNIINENNENLEPKMTTTARVIENQLENEETFEHQNQQKQSFTDGDNKKDDVNINTSTGSSSSISNQKTVNSIDSRKAKTAELSANHTSNNHYEIQRFISELIKFKADNVTIKKSWGKWSEWSSCSRSCDEGVMFQSRECMEKT